MKKKNGKMLSSIAIIIQFIAAIAIGAIALSLTGIVASAISPPNCSGISLNYLGNLILLCTPLLFVGIVSYILHKISGYDYAFLLVSFFAFWLISFSQSVIGSCGLIPSFGGCYAASGYMCQNPMPYNNTISIILKQSANKSWDNVSFIWVPRGTHSPSAGKICPALNSNTAISGLPCGSPGSINFAKKRNSK